MNRSHLKVRSNSGGNSLRKNIHCVINIIGQAHIDKHALCISLSKVCLLFTFLCLITVHKNLSAITVI